MGAARCGDDSPALTRSALIDDGRPATRSALIDDFPALTRSALIDDDSPALMRWALTVTCADGQHHFKPGQKADISIRAARFVLPLLPIPPLPFIVNVEFLERTWPPGKLLPTN